MSDTRQFDLVVFDWDGTLYDSTALIVRAIQSAAADIGAEVPSDARAAYVIGMGLVDALQYAVPGLASDRYPALVQRYRHHYFGSAHQLSLFPGTLEMLNALKSRGHLLGVATGKSRRGLDEALGTVQLRGVFDATRTADETASKPHPQMLIELMAELEIAPERTLMVGDTTHDMQLAANARVPSVAVSFGAHERAAFDDYAPRFVAHSTRELSDWLLAHG